MKKIQSAVATAVLATATIFGVSAAFASSAATEHTSQQIDASDYISLQGSIVETTQHEDRLKLFVEGPEKEPAHLIITKDTLLLDAATGEAVDRELLKEGVDVEAYYDKHKPMIMIYPPQIAPEIVIVRGEESGQVKVGKFNEDFISLDNQLKVHLDDDTILVNKQGEPIEVADLSDKEWIVFYDIATKSIPAQTMPHKIIALDPPQTALEPTPEPEPAPAPKPEVPDPDEPVSADPRMIQLRAAVEQLGYDLTWDERANRVTMTKEDQIIELTIGSASYTQNDQTHSFDTAPEIKEGRTYVPESFLSLLTK